MKYKDGSKICQRYGLTSTGEPICLNEYSTRVANYKNVHVVQLDSIQNDFKLKAEYIDYEGDWNELDLDDRSGRSNFTYVYSCSFKELRYGVEKIKENERITFLIPYHYEKCF